MTQVITRFAPSPTGYLHIGGARTALFNWLYSRHTGGKFLLRIEDTDRERSTDAAIEAILKGMKWLGLDWDGDVVYQYARANRHREVAEKLLSEGKAYKCFATPEELEAMREEAKAKGLPPRYNGKWRDRNDHPANTPYVIRLRAPREGETVIQDIVQGEVRVQNAQLDDMVLLRSDGNPTYMLSVVVDDHDMEITHIIRGDDHLTNAFRQKQLYDACGWHVPKFSHIPLIHGADGAKLSKRHGAVGLDAYEEMGILSEAMRNYLLRLGWSHQDDEIIPTDKAIEWFNLESIGRSPARFDMNKLLHLNAHYLSNSSDDELIELIWPRVIKLMDGKEIRGEGKAWLKEGMKDLKVRSKDLNMLAEQSLFYLRSLPLPISEEGAKILGGDGIKDHLKSLVELLSNLEDWNDLSTKEAVSDYAAKVGVKLGVVAQGLRVALTGHTVSPGVFEIMNVLGKEESLARLKGVC